MISHIFLFTNQSMAGMTKKFYKVLCINMYIFHFPLYIMIVVCAGFPSALAITQVPCFIDKLEEVIMLFVLAHPPLTLTCALQC